MPNRFSSPRRLLSLMIAAATLLLAGCSGIDPARYRDQEPAMDFQAFFTGPVRAWGIVQDRSGNIVRRFDLHMVGSWQGDEGRLVEDFTYYDGETQQRIWTIHRDGQGGLVGTASDIVGPARARISGNAIAWDYVMQVPVAGSTYTFRFDDWMWAMHDGVIINRSYMKKFGFTVAELTLFLQKQPPS